MSNTITFYCLNEGYEDNWIEVDRKWTGAESKQGELANLWDEILPILYNKVKACNLIRDDGSVLTDIKELTADGRYDFDPMLQGFIGGIVGNTIQRLRAVGNASARTSLPNKDGKK